jgi:hypothetical protein
MLSFSVFGLILFAALSFINITVSTPLEDILIMSGFAAFFTLGIVFAILKIGRPRKRAWTRYKQLSDIEQAEIDLELSTRPRQLQLVFGANRLYFYSDSFLFFMDYGDIAWVYQTNDAVPIVIETGGVVMESSVEYQGLVIYDCDGQRFKASARISSIDIEDIKGKSPNVIVGYSKEKKRLAKRDFKKFLMKWSN